MSTRTTSILVVLIVVVAVLMVLVPGRPPHRPAKPIGQPVQISAPLGLPPVPVPVDNPPTAETISLGHRLYYDPILSADNTVACASCHDPQYGFADPHPTSEGVQKKHGTRNSPTVLNAAYFDVQFWDGRAPNLEKQAEGPVQNPLEMAHTLDGVEAKLMADPSYRAQFEKAFGPGPITYEMVEKSIATFERTVIAGNSPFDRWYFGHDETAVSESAKRGFQVFSDPKKGNCTACHEIGKDYALFTDNKFHNIGVGADRGNISDLGRYEVTKMEPDRGAFKTPTLRNIALTAPYMHDGSLKTLKDVVDFYVGGGNSNPHLDKNIRALDFLTGAERTDLAAFLESLTGEVPATVGRPGQAKTEQASK